jgi:hypothetical protein
MKVNFYESKEIFVNFKKTTSLIEGFIYSFIILVLISGLRIINPKSTSWLSYEDGTAEIAWEFFRRQPVLQFPLGLNPSYGLEISSTIAFDGQIPLMSLILHPFNALLPDRFQYFGIFLFFTFALNFFFAKKIFNNLKFSYYQSVISAILLATSPVILNRFIENTHYSLTSSWIIFAAINLSMLKNVTFKKWVLLYIFTILIHLYFLPFVVLIHIFTLMYLSLISKKLVGKNYISLFAIVIISVLTLLLTGYFYGGISGKDSGYGLFRSTLFSLFDSSGWSRIIPDISEPDGAYEGFAYIGLPTVLLIILILILSRQKSKSSQSIFLVPVWISSIILFGFSLSNKVAAGKFELLSFSVPDSLSLLTNTFRSSGRFAWLLVFVLFIYLTLQVKNKMSDSNFSAVLTVILALTFVDYYPQLQSNKTIKFSKSIKSNLAHPAWKSISECYRNIRVYPPTVGVENYYNFVNIADQQNLGINTGRFGRVNQATILGAYDQMQKEFNTGEYRNDSFYIFTNAGFVLPEIVNYQKNLAIHTLNEESSYGEMNGYTFIAPNLKNCPLGEALKAQSARFGSPERQKYQGEAIKFGAKENSDKYILIGFSALEDWGVWSVDEYSKITFNTRNIFDFSRINIQARDLAMPQNNFKVFVNNRSIGTCNFSTEFSLCSLNYNFKDLKTNIVSIEFKPSIIRSPKGLGISDDTRNLGFGLKEIYLS